MNTTVQTNEIYTLFYTEDMASINTNINWKHMSLFIYKGLSNLTKPSVFCIGVLLVSKIIPTHSAYIISINICGVKSRIPNPNPNPNNHKKVLTNKKVICVFKQKPKLQLYVLLW